MDKKVTIDSPEFRKLASAFQSSMSFSYADSQQRLVSHIDERLNELVEALVWIVKYADSEPDGGEVVQMHRANIERARLVLKKARGE